MSAEALTPLAGLVRTAALAPLSDRELLERFAARNDHAAFEALVRRHGPLVLAACRRVLSDPADVEDAFQATFLVLLEKAPSVRWHDSVGNWLFGTAHRVAVHARARASRRRRREAEAGGRPRPDPARQEAVGLLHEELDRLPDKFRLPLLLCYLDGRTRDEAAGRLGLTPLAVKGRLERGRGLLRKRLLRRGVALSAGLLGALANSSAANGLPPRLVRSTARAAGGDPTPAVAALTRGVTAAMFNSKAKLAALALCLALLAGVSARQSPPPSGASPRPARPAPAGGPAATRADDRDSLTYAGRVLGPDGRPVAGARLYLTPAFGGHLQEPYPAAEVATTGPDGRFAFTAPRAKFGDVWTVVAATAPDHGPGWVQVPEGGKRGLTLRLVKDDVPITGQVIDLEGRPVPGAALTVLQINAAPGEDLGPWLRAAQARKGTALQLEQEHLPHFTVAFSPRVTTDADGRFRLTGVGRDRLVKARLDGPGIVSQHVSILTRPGKAVTVTERKAEPEDGDPGAVTTYHAADFKHVAAPARPVVGVVRDRDTGEPLPGVTVRSYARALGPGRFGILDTVVRATTDAEGRYRLAGMPGGDGYKVVAVPADGQPYLATNHDVPAGRGLDPVTVDFGLKRGVWIAGKVTDKVTGKPVRASVEYFSLYDNPNLKDYPGFDGTVLFGERTAGTREDGSYRVVGLPGPGLVAVWHTGTYLRATEREDESGTGKPTLSTAPYHLVIPSNYAALARVEPARGADSAERDVTLDPAWSFTGTVLGPDDKPLAGARGFGLTGQPFGAHGPMKSAEFTVRGFNPRRPRAVFFRHLEKGLVGVARPPRADGGSITVRMGPGAAVTGRLVDAEGKARAGVALEVAYRTAAGSGFQKYPPGPIRTDREGRFRLGALLPGHEYRLSDGEGGLSFGALPAGRTRDLGDVRLNPKEE